MSAKKWFGLEPSVFVASLAALFTLLIFVTYIVQTNYLGHNVATTREALWTTERAHSVVRNLRIGRWDGGQIFLRLDVINYGKSPAWVTRMHFQAQTHTERNLERQGTPNYTGLGGATGGMIAPGETMYREIEDGPGEHNLMISESERKAAYSRDIYLFIHGFVDYRDIHNRPHRSSFGYRWIADAPSDKSQLAFIENDAYWHYS